MILRIIAVLLFFVGAIVTLFFREYTGELIPYPALFWTGGSLLCVIAVILWRASYRMKETKEQKDQQNNLERFKQQAKSLRVDLTRAEVIRHDYKQEVENNLTGLPGLDSRIKALDSITDESRNTRVVNVNQSIIQLVVEVNGRKYKIASPVLDIDYATLMFKLYAKKETIVYYHDLAARDYYIDLDFLR